MGTGADGLLDILSEECRLYSDLYDISRKKSELILNGNIEGLTAILSYEQQFILELGQLETQREALIENYARIKGIKPKNATLEQIIVAIDSEAKTRLEDVTVRLRQIISAQKDINDLNERLIKNNLEFIDFSIKLLAGQEESGAAYSKGGKTAVKSQNRNLIDKRV